MKTNESSAHIAAPAVILLPEHVTVRALSAMCRDAWRVFVEQSEEWCKAEHVLWSTCLYAPVLQCAAGAEGHSDHDYETIDARFLKRMIETARTRAFEALEVFALPRARLAFGRRMRELGAVTRCEDRLGNTGYVPTPLTGSLADRILALLAADLLNRPGDFEGETLCSDCGGIVVGPTPCCARYEGRDTGVPSRRIDTASAELRDAG